MHLTPISHGRFIWLLSYISIASVSAAMITPALPLMEQVFDVSHGAIEWVVSIFLIGYVAGQLIYAPLANRFGRLKALKWGLNLNLMGLLICLASSYIPHYLGFLVGRLITGLGSAAGLTCTFMLINEWLPETQRKSAMAYSILSFALGIGLAVLIGGVITQFSQWPYCFVVLLAQGVLMRLGVNLFQETLMTPKSGQISALLLDYKHALSSKQLLIFSAIWGVCTAVGYCYAAAAPQIAHSYLKLTAAQYGYWNVLNIGGMLVGGLSARKLMHMVAVKTVIRLGYAGSMLSILGLSMMYYYNYTQPVCFFSLTASLYCFSSYFFAGGSYMASNAIADKASASSMMSFINMLVATTTVIIMGYISTNALYGFIKTLLSLILLTFVAFLCSRTITHE